MFFVVVLLEIYDTWIVNNFVYIFFLLNSEFRIVTILKKRNIILQKFKTGIQNVANYNYFTTSQT